MPKNRYQDFYTIMAQNITYPDPPINMVLFIKLKESESEIDTMRFGFKGVVSFHLPFNILALPSLFSLLRPRCDSTAAITTITYLKPSIISLGLHPDLNHHINLSRKFKTRPDL
ncbi:unnamed protein product [Vicia faba]|uniref:Uncharacterized protein n=1 Tax=Vicia faba TaxID=3906 RepID=A0AAV1A4H6_VICFA|nr:unnamed protein product [Vicia faba]